MNRYWLSLYWLGWLFGSWGGWDSVAAAAEPMSFSPQQIELFEKKVRPVLAEHCYSCHGEKKSMAGLRLDSRAAVLKGSDAGPVVKPGEPSQSLLIELISHHGERKMPPKTKLADSAIADLTEWVKLGLPWPANEQVAPADPFALAKTHWALQPIRDPTLPALKNPDPTLTPIDRFVVAALEAKGFSLGQPADRRTLIRRAYYDLIGLPPTAEEIEAFVRDTDPNAWEKLIDHLLASPHYGERWARYWLDLARYADTKGYVFQEDRNYPFAYTYRDYVVRAFNDDLPYNRFILEQLAGDRLATDNDKRPLAALGFLTLGRRFLNNIHDIIDDRIDVVTRTFLGLTVSCARCHDHKFDPISAKDYYSLYGIFASSVEPKDLPLLSEPMDSPAVAAFEKELKKREADVQALLDKLHARHLEKLRSAPVIADYLNAVRDTWNKADQLGRVARERDLTVLVMQRWRTQIADAVKMGPHPIWSPFVAFAQLPNDQFEQQSAALLRSWQEAPNSAKRIHPLLAAALQGQKLTHFGQVAQIYGRTLAEAAKADPKDASRQALAEQLLGPNAAVQVPRNQVEQLIHRGERNQLRALQAKVDQWKATSPAAPARAMVLVDAPNPVQPYVFLRGNPANRGPNVPRQFLQVLASKDAQRFTNGSGRLELAQAIARADNPLTGRVLVNRVWLHHFGQGLVRTPSDFGIRTEPPTHPELLDWLTTRFIEDGWSLKKLHKRIMLSKTYQQTSDPAPELLKADPENRLLGRMNRRRLDFEALRDSLLFVSGKLDPSIGGRPVDLFTEPFPTRRTLYGFIDRQNLPGVFRAFDFAGPDTHSPQRFQTTVPQQALFLMNNPFVVQQAKALMARPELADLHEPRQRIDTLYRLVYGRSAEPDEIQMALNFIGGTDGATADGKAVPADAWKYGYGSFDEKTGRVRKFTPLPHFTGQAWQGGPAVPDAQLGWAILSAEGGHPGTNPEFAVIRRWVAPQSGWLRIEGELYHPANQGDGVRARIVSSRSGLAGEWTAHHNKKATPIDRLEVQPGDTIDFIVDCLDNIGFDGFWWSPKLRLTPNNANASALEWDAASDFRGPHNLNTRMTPWERLAQILLLSNEFAFVD